MNRVLLIVGLSAVAAIPANALAAPGDMTLDKFLPVAERVQAKGMAAMFSSDLKTLRGEVEGASTRYRARIDGDRKAGRSPHSCPPKKGSMNSEQLLTHMRSYPANTHSKITVKSAFYDLMKREYPC